MDDQRRSLLSHRIASALLIVVVAPVAIGLIADGGEAPLELGEPASRTVFASERVRVVDEEETDRARRAAAESVEAVQVFDRAAQTAIVNDLRGVFSDVRVAREPIDTEPDDEESISTRTPTRSEQLDLLASELPDLDAVLIEGLVDLDDDDLDVVEREAIATAQELARERVERDDLDTLIRETLPGELALRPLPGDTAETIVSPLIIHKMRPTVVVDPDATAAARQRAADGTPEVARVWLADQTIVREGEIVDAMSLQAIEQLGAAGTSPIRAVARAMLAMLVVTIVGGVYLQRMQPRVWASGKKQLLLGILVTTYALIVVGATALVGTTAPGWAFVAPAGALAMLTALLIHPVVGIATMLPASLLVPLVVPGSGTVSLFAAAAVLVSVPLTTRIAKRSDLRTATLRAGLSYPVLAGAIVLAFGPTDQLFTALLAGAINGAVTVILVQGALPFLESLFRLPTVTALLDLADRNHPLLRELETKALGSYNHSVMVATLTERACREIGADPLLGTVAALYHDIGKVRQPHYFIENQQGIANPHDDLEPAVSAIIIQNHVIDGVELAVRHRLPPEVVACIRSHHGTMLVSWFYDAALREAAEGEVVDEEQFRYKGGRPRSKEAAVLLLADCSEATTRAMAMERGTIPREDIETTVDRLLQERISDGQFEESELTFRELMTARDTIVQSLVGIYHPRIPYPKKAAARAEARELVAPARSDDQADHGQTRAATRRR
ncbi:MAG: HDIG domain-containing metalloprotein [Nitriliruptoraceae bacterium]